MSGIETLPRDLRAAVGAGEMERLAFVDALRGWAILAVLAVHTTMFTTSALPPHFGSVVAQGPRGVQLFYVVSAFTLFLSLARRKEREQRPIRNFFIRRFFRIAPMFYVALVLFLKRDGLGPRYWLGDAPGLSAGNTLANVFFVNGWSPYTINSIVPIGWSVAIEMMFYLTLPFLFRMVKDLRAALWLTLGALIGSVLLNQIMIRMLPPIGGPELWRNFLFMWLPSQAPVFCLGIVLYFCWQNLDAGGRELGVWFLWAGILSAAIACFGGYSFLPGHFVFGIAFVLLALGLAARRSIFWVNPITKLVGKASYSFYLTHLLVLPFCAKALNEIYNRAGVYWPGLTEYFLLWITAALASFCAAWLCYSLIERPGIEFGRRWIQRLEAR